MKETSTLSNSDRSKRLTARLAGKRGNIKNDQENVIKPKGKRSVSEMSPGKQTTRKRTAFGDITNAIQAHSERISLARKKKNVKNETIVSIAKTRGRRSTEKTKVVKTITTRRSAEKKAKLESTEILNNVLETDLISSSNENENSVLNTINESNIMNNSNNTSMSSTLNCSKSRPVPNLPASILAMEQEADIKKGNIKTPKNKPTDLRPYDTDIDPFVVSEYAECVFNNMKKRERKFLVCNYLVKPFTETTGPMRAILVDWLVEVQENFELYHETLYLAVKITDNYLQNNSTPKEQLQLVGATALLIACKIEERHPPPLDDFQFICDDAYTHRQFVEMEVRILKALDFDINIPHPYRFLRRFARVTSMTMPTLTLARYVLELSLHDAKFVDVFPSKIAAACLFLALKMKNEFIWDSNLSYHTGYEEDDLIDLSILLNTMVEEAPRSKLQTVRTKYSHQIFFEVAKIPAVDPLLL